ncbi:hypothetical protein BBF96_09315 [Anoxybacter fermentans]|uniref:Prepilin-type N-terminal cleavage/methylation domain-containing protein n=1 Tax=Anoxybacter fermentans TaxID=1323375 RepID=A0A3Q9HQP3_9FIRM|nr:hypothetical protein [Anoxybacter fermentans]AZR73570.1 hypothetical protein BBF96_09315 [Anoxybacter fermentans]
MAFKSGKEGFVLLELLLALLILEIGILAIAELFLRSIEAGFNTEISLQALELLRGEMEKLKTVDFSSLKSQTLRELEKGIWFSLEVENVDQNSDGSPEYKVLSGKVLWQEYGGYERSYQIVTYRCRL